VQLAPPSLASVGNFVDMSEFVQVVEVAVLVRLDTGGCFASATAALSKQLNRVFLVTRDELERFAEYFALIVVDCRLSSFTLSGFVDTEAK
jgi:hypothetical protein